MKVLLKRWLSESTRRRVRRLGRVRWITKAGVVRRNGHSPLRWWRYVLTDPEVDSFTYRIANRPDLARALAPVLARTPDAVLALLAETDTDPQLRAALRQPLAHVLWAKRQPEPRAYHQACWAIIRALRPARVVETGILDGMASTVMLAALERNAAEGDRGELLSFDIMPGAGAMVPDGLRARWRPVCGDAVASIERLAPGPAIGFFTSDSLPDAAHVRRELDAVLAHGADAVVALTTWGSLADLGWPAATVRVTEQPVGHFFRGGTLAVARIERAG